MIELQVIGNLGADAVMNKTNNDRSVINFNVCRSEIVKKRMEAMGEEKKQWIDCAYFCGDNELLKLLTKGTLVLAKGTPDTKIHIKKDGTPISVQCLRISRVEILSRKRKDELIP